ncbi:MAG: DUF6117 family protein [Actinobacteria bacterium]|nr:DUF6117 family protein [Actinomycetota bacterium]
MAIPEGHKANLETLQRAVRNDGVALVECTDKVSKKPIYVVCGVLWDGKEYIMTPLAKMFDGDPYEEVNPPSWVGVRESR